MKSHELIFFSLLSLIVAFSGCYRLSADEPYNFPVKPGTPEWKTLGSHTAMTAVCQVPGARLHVMTTRALIITVLEYPLDGDILAYNFPQEGVDAIARDFNGLPELYTRKDAGAELYALWGNPLTNENFIRSGAYRCIFAQYAILKNLNRSNLDSLIKNVFNDIESAYTAEGRYSAEQGYNLWLLGRALEVAGSYKFMMRAEKDIGLRNFLLRGSFLEDDLRSFLLSAAGENLG